MRYHDTRGYKYTVAEQFKCYLDLFSDISIATEHFIIRHGLLYVKEGYAWDGPSGPTWDTPCTMVPSLVHDVLYQAIREGLISSSRRFDADLTFYRLMRNRISPVAPAPIGSPLLNKVIHSIREHSRVFWGHFRALYFFLGVRIGGGYALRHSPAIEPQDKVLEVD